MPVHSTTPKHRHPPPRRSRHFRPAALIILGFATLGCSDPAGIAAQPAPAPTTVSTAAPAATTTAPPATTAAPTTTPKVEVPRLVGMKLASARQRLASHGLKLRVRYRPTARFAAGTVISQSRRMGVGVARSSAITLVIAKALPPPPPTTQPRPRRRLLRGAVTRPTKAPASTPPPPTTTAPEAPETAPSTSRAQSRSALPTPSTSTPTTTASAANPTDGRVSAPHVRVAR
jgi:hypothetical protein